MGTFMICDVCYYKSKGETALQGASRNGPGQKMTSKTLSYSKILVIRDLSARPGSNLRKFGHIKAPLSLSLMYFTLTVTILMGEGRNKTLYDEHLGGRDSDLFGESRISIQSID